MFVCISAKQKRGRKTRTQTVELTVRCYHGMTDGDIASSIGKDTKTVSAVSSVFGPIYDTYMI